MGIGPEREVCELACLAGGCLSDIGAPVPDLADEQASQPVQVSLAVLVEDILAFPANDHRDVSAGEPRVPGEVQPEVTFRGFLQGGGVECGRGVHLVPQW